MIAKVNAVAKALVAFAVPTGAFVGDVGAAWLDVADDGYIEGTEWNLLAVAVVSAFLVWLKANGSAD